MNTRTSSYTGRSHRSMESAFGPHCGNVITEPTREFDWQDKVVMVASVVTGIAVLVIVFWGI